MTSRGLTRSELEALGRRTQETLRAHRAVARGLDAVIAAAPWTLVAPCLALLARFATGSSLVPVWLVVALAAAPLVVLVFVRVGREFSVPLEPRAGLARIDRDLDLHDGLRTAHEFLGRAECGPFEAAAIADVAPVLPLARAYEPERAAHGGLPRRTSVALLVAAIACALLPWLAPRHAGGARAEDETAVAPLASVVRPRVEPDATTTPPSDPQRDAREPRERKPAEPSKGSKPEERAAREDSERAPRESTGKSGEGRSADASPSSNPSSSQGVPSSQSQPSTSAEPTRAPTKKPKPKKSQEGEAAPKKKPLQESGATAGRGVGSGSSKNPGATDWASKDQVSTDEEPPPSEDEEVDDEDSESEARGGLQPNLRDRRPAVNRDLTIGFGNQPNPDANGRGGPSEQKKSRGVASLVLGVPIPDHVKGRPNPGRTKITQERVEPRAEEAADTTAGDRPARRASFGPVARRELDPWMGSLLSNWFQRTHRTPPSSNRSTPTQKP